MKGTLKKRMDKDAWFVVFQSNAYNENDMAYDLLKSQEIDIDMYDVYKDGDEVTFEVVNKKWAKITPFLYPFETKSSKQEISDESWEGCDGCTEQDEVMYKNGYVKGYNAAIADLPKEISDEEIEEEISKRYMHPTQDYAFRDACKWYREQLKQRQ